MPRAARSDSRVDTGLLVFSVAISLFAIILPASLRDPVAGALRRTIVSPLVSLQRGAERGRNALVTHDSLTRLNDSLALRVLRQASLEGENERLRRQLGLAAELKWGFVAAEALRGRGMGEEYSVTLTAGTEAGVRQYSPVVAPEGIVGMVETVDPTMSLAIVWAHPDFRVSAMAADGTAFGIVKAHQGQGAARWLLEMSGVPFRQQLKAGAVIVSSGLGGTYPRGIPVGTVLEEVKTSEGWARTYLLRPAVQPSDITTVMILLPTRVQAGVEGTWKPAPAESIAKAAAAMVPRRPGDTSAARVPVVAPGAAVPGAAVPGAPGAVAAPVPVAPTDSAAPVVPRRRRIRDTTVKTDSVPPVKP